jgi:site-specific DNA-methyltransferase (cytosine-N4-specific)
MDAKMKKLKSIDWTFKDDTARPGRHGLHRYPATMHASCVASCLDVFQPTSVLDPFGGSGTVALECAKRGLPVYNNDLNPLARLITESKLLDYDQSFEEKVEALKKEVRKQEDENRKLVVWAKQLFPQNEAGQKEKEKDANLFEKFGTKFVFPRFKNISYWFHPEVIVALKAIKDVLPNEPFFKMCFSEVVRIVSNRRSGEFKLFRRPVKELLTYSPNVFDDFIKILDRNWKLVINDPIVKGDYRITANDARTLEDVPDDFASLMVTSPPYGDSRTTVAYGQFSRLSSQWLDLEDASTVDNRLLGGTNDRAEPALFGTIKNTIRDIAEIDAKRAEEVQDFFVDLYEAFYSIDKKCKQGAHQVWVVGNRLVKGIRTPLDTFIKEAGEEFGYDCVNSLSRDIPYKSMPKQNAPSGVTGAKSDTMTEETIVVLQKK